MEAVEKDNAIEKGKSAYVACVSLYIFLSLYILFILEWRRLKIDNVIEKREVCVRGMCLVRDEFNQYAGGCRPEVAKIQRLLLLKSDKI